MGGVRPWGDMWLGNWDRPGYNVTPHTDKAEKVWLRLVNANRDEVCREFRYGSLHWSSEDICLHVSCKDTLTQLPPDAVRLDMPRKRRVELYVVDGLSAGLNTEYSSDSKEERPSTYISADAHALYAYPLSAIMFVGVDVPVTLASPIWLIPYTCVSISQLYK